MTKKSHARQQRDAAEKAASGATNDKAKKVQAMTQWDDLNDLGIHMSEMLVNEPGAISQLFSIPELMLVIDEPQEVSARLIAMDSDVNTFCTTLEAIKALHAGRAGSATDPEDNAASIKIFEQYVQFEASYRAVVFPNVLFLSEKAGAAVERAKAQREANAANVNVITDAVVKEPTPEVQSTAVEEVVTQ